MSTSPSSGPVHPLMPPDLAASLMPNFAEAFLAMQKAYRPVLLPQLDAAVREALAPLQGQLTAMAETILRVNIAQVVAIRPAVEFSIAVPVAASQGVAPAPAVIVTEANAIPVFGVTADQVGLLIAVLAVAGVYMTSVLHGGQVREDVQDFLSSITNLLAVYLFLKRQEWHQ